MLGFVDNVDNIVSFVKASLVLLTASSSEVVSAITITSKSFLIDSCPVFDIVAERLTFAFGELSCGRVIFPFGALITAELFVFQSILVSLRPALIKFNFVVISFSAVLLPCISAKSKALYAKITSPCKRSFEDVLYQGV